MAIYFVEDYLEKIRKLKVGAVLVFLALASCQSENALLEPVSDTSAQGDIAQSSLIRCGDGQCSEGESSVTCQRDCSSLCGDGSCNGSEDHVGCPVDCAVSCGDGLCDGDENTLTCSQDCGTECGDAVCYGTETSTSCPQDCGALPTICGDGLCEGNETFAVCADDCATVCGDSVCEESESTLSCVADCGTLCGDSACNGEETAESCPGDCGSSDPGDPICGDGVCEGGENSVTCVADCGAVCGDKVCNGGEDSFSCPGDCGITGPGPAICGDGVCEGSEDSSSCAQDCPKDIPEGVDPSKDVKGYIDGVTVSGAEATINGWACHVGWNGSISVEVYVGGEKGVGTFLKAHAANIPNEDPVNAACEADGGDHRFHIPLTSQEIAGHGGETIYVHGVSPAGNEDLAIANSGQFVVPDFGAGPVGCSGCLNGVSSCAQACQNLGYADGSCKSPGSNDPTSCCECFNGGTTTPIENTSGPVGKWRRRVISISTTNYSGNPYQVALEATFVHQGSNTTYTVPGYYDGANTWKVGFMPTKVGTWTYTTASPTGALSGHTGTVDAVASGHRGLLAGDPAYPDKWKFSDGPHVVPIGVFVNAMLEDAPIEQFAAMADFMKANQLHLLNFRISEHDKAFSDVGGAKMHLERWQRLEQRMEILTDRGLGVDIMLYTDDAGKPSFGPQSAQEQLLIRYTVARLSGFPSVMFNSGIDLAEYRDQAWVNWFGQQIKALDPYGHPVSSRYSGGSGNQAMQGQTYNSLGDRNSQIGLLLAAYNTGDGVPAANNDNWSEDLTNNVNGHTVHDIRRAAWKATISGGVAFHVRHNTMFCPAGITECDRYFHISQLHNELDSEHWLAKVNPFIQEHLGTTFASMNPSPGLVDGGGGKYALSDPARTRILYFLMGQGDSWDAGDGGAVVMKLGGVGGSYEATWFDPRTGSLTPAGTHAGAGDIPLAPPSTEDWLLVLKRI